MMVRTGTTLFFDSNGANDRKILSRGDRPMTDVMWVLYDNRVVLTLFHARFHARNFLAIQRIVVTLVARSNITLQLADFLSRMMCGCKDHER